LSDWKAINTQRLATVHPILGQRVQSMIDDLAAKGVPVLVTQALRTWDEQAALYAKGRTPKEIAAMVHKHGQGGAVTDAPAGFSSHNFGLAVDLVPSAQVDNPQPDWNINHADWIAMLTAGPDFKLAEGAKWRSFADNPHFYMIELDDTPTDAMRNMYKAFGLPRVWDYVNSVIASKAPSAPAAPAP
jgi:peptidoglycan LD-endopeptidase CwlK